MKIQIFCYLFSVLICSLFAQQYGWIDISANIPTEASLSDVFFVSDDEGWITTSSFAEIYHTADGGETFEVQTTPLGATSAIHMLDESHGYSGGTGGWVYNTSNGGLNWIMLATMASLTDISFPFNTNINNPIGYACGDAGRVWKITSTLTDLNSPSQSDFGGISAPSVNNVWICGGNRIYYYNGTDFTSQIAPTATFNDIYFINDLEGWVVGDGGVIGHTTDGGNTWNTQTNPDPQNLSLSSVFFLDSDRGWAVGNGGIILQTTDGGTTWTIEGAGLTTAALRGIHFTSATNGYVVGNERTLFKFGELTTTDGNIISGETLQLQNFPNPFNPSTTIDFSIQNDSQIELSIYNIKGQEIKILLNEQKQTGEHSIIWNGDDESGKFVSSGIYYYKLNINGKTEAVTKCLLLK